eukprot:TRINITY_DN55_c1_g1_i1.p5 TRINITY_DN55_c1_g1~~TRINITY_DN55_c1_g1_i1.p5  ORF type:complete len:163 (+),score=68.77 TRINITY_DN55_c1_g1_i1:5193-5681(+)
MAMRVVMQSVERASLLVDNVDKWVEIGRGLVVYVCFLKEAHEDAVKKAAHDVLHCKIFPHVDEACQRHRPAAALGENWDIMVVPQATLGGKLKGKQAQYHGQCEKAKGEELYQLFCGSLAEGIAAHDRGDASAPTFAAGTYGNRQGLKFESLGPFSHHVEYQ